MFKADELEVRFTCIRTGIVISGPGGTSHSFNNCKIVLSAGSRKRASDAVHLIPLTGNLSGIYSRDIPPVGERYKLFPANRVAYDPRSIPNQLISRVRLYPDPQSSCGNIFPEEIPAGRRRI